MKIVKVFAVSVMLAALPVQLAFADHTPGERNRGAPDNGEDFGECLSNFVSKVEWEVDFYGDSYYGTGIGSLAALAGGANPAHVQAMIGFAKAGFPGPILDLFPDPDWINLSCDAGGATLKVVFVM